MSLLGLSQVQWGSLTGLYIFFKRVHVDTVGTFDVKPRRLNKVKSSQFALPSSFLQSALDEPLSPSRWDSLPWIV